jgi:hypothetical protein
MAELESVVELNTEVGGLDVSFGARRPRSIEFNREL